MLPKENKFQFDWQLGAAIFAAPFCWWLLSITIAKATPIEFAELGTRRFLVVALLYPVLEEIVFRGLVQGALLKTSRGRRKRLGISVANIITSAVFAALHVLRRVSTLSAAVFVPSLVFGYFRERYGNLYVPIALHIFYNAGFVLLFY